MPIPNTNNYRRRPDGSIAIKTRLGDVFLIDEGDETIARRHCWSRHEHGYARAVARINGKLKTVYLHRLICPTTEDHPHVDHVSGNTADCRRSNLRACTRQENLRNQKLRADTRTGLKGVGLHKQTGKYRARVGVGGAKFHLGLFDTPDDAYAAAVRHRESLHGEFAIQPRCKDGAPSTCCAGGALGGPCREGHAAAR